MAGKGGGAWKVAYADFVTAMMAFFMVMWLVGQKEDLKEAVAHHFNHPFEAFPEEPDDDASGAGEPCPGADGLGLLLAGKAGGDDRQGDGHDHRSPDTSEDPQSDEGGGFRRERRCEVAE